MKLSVGKLMSLLPTGSEVLAGSLALAMFITTTASAQWTQFGGPDQSFKATSKGLAKDWPTEGPRKLWSRELGEGYSAILADGGRLYTMYRSDEKEKVICLDAKTGKTIWEHAYDSAPREGYWEQFGKGPRATPLLVDGRLYTIGVEGLMHCLNPDTGKVLWSHDLWREFDGTVLGGGYSSSPIEYKNTIITLVGGKDQSIIAFDKKDGSVVWKNLTFENSFSTPKIMKIGGEDQLVTFMAKEVIGADPDNGELKWQYPFVNEWKENITMPLQADDGTVVISAVQAGARGLRLTKNGDKFEVEEAWSTPKIQLYHCSTVQIGDYFYASTGLRGPFFMTAVNMKTGDIAWRKRGFTKANVVYADGRFIILDEDGNLALATADPEDLTVHSKVKLLEKVSWTAPTVVGKALYVRDQKNIMAVDLG